MRLPSATAYMEALQDPSTCFADAELRAGVAALSPLGLPRAVSGNVATVFRVDSEAGKSWAVRCFVRPVDRERLRYEAVGAHLARLHSTWRVPFDFQPCGIQVDGEWWPLLKMAWAPGELLVPYVRRHLWDGPALAYLAQRIAWLSERLRADGVAHGDLQHGNIVVAPGGDLRLVDYDGMYVPALEGWPGTERGHRNYQHPGRANADFGPGLDHFSSWVLYASLAALSADPLLWGRLDGGEDALLLRQHDLESPDRSPGFAALEASEAPGVADLATLLRSFLDRSPDDVPALSPAMAAVRTAVDGGAPTESADLTRRQSLHEALQGGPVRTGVPPRPSAPAPPPWSAAELSPARATLVAACGAAIAMVLAVSAGLVPVAQGAVAEMTLGAIAVGRLRHLYRSTPHVLAVRRTGTGLADPRRTLAYASATVQELERRREEASAAAAAAGADAERAAADLRCREEQEVRQVEDGMAAALAAVAAAERETHREEEDAMAAALAALQNQVVQDHLTRHRVGTASARGVSDAVVHWLEMHDMRTAADITTVAVERAGAVVTRPDGRRLHMSGVDPRQAEAVTAWRHHVEAAARLNVPTTLPPDAEAAIRAPHARRRAALAVEADTARADARREAAHVRARWQAEHDRVVAALEAVEAGAARRRVEIDRELNAARKRVAEAEWWVHEQERQTGRPPELPLIAYVRRALGVH